VNTERFLSREYAKELRRGGKKMEVKKEHALAQSQSLPSPDRTKLAEYPTLSLSERDRRWRLIRKMMDENDVKALITIPGGPWDDPSSYLTNYLWPRHPHRVFFPLQGEPVAFVGFHSIPIDVILKSEAYGIQSWVKDWRCRQDSADDWVALLKERGLTNCHIGIIGNGPFSSGMQTLVASTLMNSVKTALPDVTFVDVYDLFVGIMLVKDQEEMAMFRKAALVMEVAAEEFIQACKPGNTVADVQKAFVSALTSYGVDIWRTEVSSEPDGGRGIVWMGNGLKPPVIQKGHLVCTELFGNVGALHAQAQMTVSVGEPTEEKVKLATLAREAYEIGLATLRPGITFGELAEAMEKPNQREGAWNLTPLAHTMNPHVGVTKYAEEIRGPRGFTGINARLSAVGIPKAKVAHPELVIQEGMTFQLEPNACYGRTYVNIGGNVLVTKHGCEELNRIPTHMVVVPG
jgi:Xaa-Pro aminopeptidase